MGLADLADFSLFAIYFLFIYNLLMPTIVNAVKGKSGEYILMEKVRNRPTLLVAYFRNEFNPN